ncbi:MAG: hypothetical protein HW412_2663 [Bacteroidetes bacterium]|nr:hypothetical protein [Bacteroidota bacterium]
MESLNKRFASMVVLAIAAIVVTGCNKDESPVGPAAGPVVTEYTQVQSGWATSSGTNGIFSTVKSQSPVPGYAARMGGIANINVGIFEHPVVTTYLQNRHNGNPGNYRVEATYNWKGSIAGNGIAGTGAQVQMTMQILDLNGNLITSYDIHEKEVRASAFQIGGIIDQGTKQIVVDFTLPQGKTGFNIRFRMRCEAWSGLLGAISQCNFGNTSTTGHYSGWSTLKVTAL